ncbi:hypothetical protein JYT76_01780 [Olleya sp. AH-315-F22]|nr:hypothetical protein [Olleya sp. AH-315-F22]
MAPINFEDNLKEKLEERRLQPSKNAWEKLQTRLDENENIKESKSFWWLGIAASFVGILIVVSVFFNKKDDNTIKQSIVNTEDVQEPKSIDKTIIQSKDENPLAFEKIQTETINKNITEKPSELKALTKQEQKEIIEEVKKDAVAQVETERPKDIKVNNIETEIKQSFEDLKLQEIVAQVQELKKVNNTVTDAEINVLLDQAERDIALHKLYNENTKKVDATALLQDVEADLEQSFRERAFKAIKSGYNYVKTTVAERNN